MKGHGGWRTSSLITLLVAAIGAGQAAAQREPAVVDGPPPTLDETLRDDAALADVCFVDRATGWAVGDRGVIWHTRDGGATWHRQSSHVDCSLKSVFFLDAARGWVVGGANKPYAAATQGVVLRTIDGGATWTPVPNLLLPTLNGVRFFDTEHGVAFGMAAPMFPSGVFATRDGGQSWQPLPSDGAGNWLAGDFVAADAGALAGPDGRFATFARRQVISSPLSTPSPGSFRAMRLAAPTGGWIVGDGGVVATTGDLGRSWQTPPGALPDRAAQHFDFHAVAVQGPNVWIAGSPGSRVFHSPDDGQTWHAYATGQTAPLRALEFVDAQRGWAAGELGAILATQDGGRTWHRQRSGGRRAALLAIFARPDNVPLEVIAQQGAEDGYLTAVDVLCRPASRAAGTTAQRWSRPGTAGVADDPARQARAREAMLLAGATSAETAWRFPLPPDDLALPPADLLAALDRANDGRAIERLLGRLVRQIRTWRPEVILTHHGAKEPDDSMASLVEQLVTRAAEAAADPTQFVELTTAAGLDAWQVKRVYGLLPPGAHGSEQIVTGQFSPRLGATLAGWSLPARRLLFADYTPPPDAWELDLLMSRAETVDGSRGLFRGIALAPGGDARRRTAIPPAGNLDELRRQVARRRNVEELLQRTEGNAAWAAQIVQLTDGLPANGGGELMFQLAEGYRTSGRLDLAADTYYLLARRYADHPLAEQALRWLVQYYASSEAGLRIEDRGSRNDRIVGQTAVRNPKSEINSDPDAVKQASAETPLPSEAPPAVGLARDERLRRAVELGKYLEAARPMLFAEPGVRFPIVAAERQLGFANSAKRYFLTLRPLPESDPWRRCAETEQWLSEASDQPPPKTLANCRQAGQRPHLDGQLDEPFWQTADVLQLQSDPASSVQHPVADSPWRTSSIRLVYDRQFLYLAVRCPKVAGGDYADDDRPRPRDADLSAHDRVALRFDVDRDYTTHFELVVDHRGWTRDACWGDVHWNPIWYVAAADDGATWTVEAAVPLAELVSEPPAARHVWAVAARRTIPRVGYESWSGDPARDDSPDQYGLLIFE